MNRGKEFIGISKFDPKDLTKEQGHEYGAGRGTRKHEDRRSKRRRTRRDRLAKELEDE